MQKNIDFTVQTDKANDFILVTPESDRAYSWAHGSPIGSLVVKEGRFAKATRWGRSFLFTRKGDVARDVTHMLHAEGFRIVNTKLAPVAA